MKSFFTLTFLFTLTVLVNAQSSDWPKILTASDGSVIKLYQMQPESFSGNQLRYRSAVSIQDNKSAEPLFGTFWAVATVETDRDNRRLSILSVKIPNIKFADDSDAERVSFVKSVLENQIPAVSDNLQLDPLLSSLDMRTEEKKISKGLNNTPPAIIYSNHPAILVLIDGTPKFQYNSDWGVDAVVNSPFTIVKTNNRFYLYGSKKWFYANSVTGPYQYTNSIPSNLKKIETAVNNSNNANPEFGEDATAETSDVTPEVIVSTVPAELIQTNGEANFSPVSGTNLLYAANTANDIFMDTQSQKYYVLVSGRWYASSQLNKGNWQYVASNSLPADFAKIPEGSTKDNVLASVAGTDAAREAIMDAQIPQTAKVDRKTATANVTYDGSPSFESIPGTSMQYAVNTPGSVIKYQGRYYCVEKGVWFDGPTPTGPWSVSTNRPDQIDMIPPNSPVYNTKYVYIYDVTPDWVYMGYTPGYLNAYIYGPTVVYGTGFYYRPWYGRYYYPRPYTWGFSMHYNPWTGWDLGFDYSFGWFNVGFGSSIWGGWCGGWWGPTIYHPPYRINPYNRNYGYYGRNSYSRNNIVVNNNNFYNNNRTTNNIYNYRRDVYSSNNNRVNATINNNRANNNNSYNRPGGNYSNAQRTQPGSAQQTNQQPGNGNNARGERPRFDEIRATSPAPERNAVVTDREGNVFQRNQQGQWQQNQQRQWQPVQQAQRPQVVQNLERQQQMQQRGETRVQNFQAQRNASAAPAARPSGGGNNGGGRPSGNNGNRRNR
jgi:hypothetical protein